MERSRGAIFHQWISICGSVLIVVVAVSLFIHPATSVDPNLETCSGNAGREDTCPSGMYCDGRVGGTCRNCSYCHRITLTSQLQLIKCLCDSRGTSDPARVCIAPTVNEEDYPVYRNSTDLVDDDLDPALYYHLINGTRAQNIRCPVLATSQPAQPTTPTPTPLLTTKGRRWGDFSTGGVASTANPACGKPIDISYGRVDSFGTGGKVHYTCTEGYNLRGDPDVACGLDGQYIGPFPECQLQGSNLQWFVWLIITVAISVLFLVLLVSYHVYKKFCRKLLLGDLESCGESRNATVHADTVMLSDVHAGGCNENASPKPPAETDRMLNSNGDEAVLLTGYSTSSGSRSSDSGSGRTSQVDASDSSTRVSSVESAVSVHASDLMDLCDCKISEVAWTAIKTKTRILLDDEVFRTSFVRHLFRDSNQADEGYIQRISGYTPETNLFEAIREETDTFSLDKYSILGATLLSTKLRVLFPAKAVPMEELLNALRKSHEPQSDCKMASDGKNEPFESTPV